MNISQSSKAQVRRSRQAAHAHPDNPAERDARQRRSAASTSIRLAASDADARRDTEPTAEFVAGPEAEQCALKNRVRAGRLVEPARTRRAAQRRRRNSGTTRMSDLNTDHSQSPYHDDEDANNYKKRHAPAPPSIRGLPLLCAGDLKESMALVQRQQSSDRYLLDNQAVERSVATSGHQDSASQGYKPWRPG